jgi:hypothetical protein
MDDAILGAGVTECLTMRNHISSQMSTTQLNGAISNLLYMSNDSTYNFPRNDRLGETPLLGAIICSMQLAENLKRKHDLQLVSTVIVTDGSPSSYFRWEGVEAATENMNGSFPIIYKNRIYSATYRTLMNDLLHVAKDDSIHSIVGFYIGNHSGIDQKRGYENLPNHPAFDSYYGLDADQMHSAETLPNSLNTKGDIQENHINRAWTLKSRMSMLSAFLDNIA